MRLVTSWSQIITFIPTPTPSNHIHTAFLRHHLSVHRSPKTAGHFIHLSQHDLISHPRTVFLFNSSCKIHSSPVWSFSAGVRGPLPSNILVSQYSLYICLEAHTKPEHFLRNLFSSWHQLPVLFFLLLPVPGTVTGLRQIFSKYLLNTWMNIKQKLILKMTNDYNPFSGQHKVKSFQFELYTLSFINSQRSSPSRLNPSQRKESLIIVTFLHQASLESWKPQRALRCTKVYPALRGLELTLKVCENTALHGEHWFSSVFCLQDALLLARP